MTLQEYSQLALRTFSNGSKEAGGRYDDLHTGQMSALLTGNLLQFLRTMELVGKKADLWKRGLYYGKFPEGKTIQVLAAIPDIYALTPTMQRVSKPEVRDVVHALLGAIGEAAESAEWLLQYLRGEITEEVFMKRIAEESGDLLWYTNLQAHTVSTLPAVAETNINKLRVRYPQKFTTELAVNRNLQAEEEALGLAEKGQSEHGK